MNAPIKPFSKIAYLFRIIKYRASKIDFVIKQDVEGHEFDVFADLTSLAYSGFFFFNSVLTPLDLFNIEMHQATRNGEIIDKKKYINNFLFKVA